MKDWILYISTKIFQFKGVLTLLGVILIITIYLMLRFKGVI